MSFAMEPEFWAVVPKIATPIALAAFVVACITTIAAMKIRSHVSLLGKVSPEKLPEALSDAVKAWGIKLDPNVGPKGQLKLALKILQMRLHVFWMVTGLSTVVVLCGSTLIGIGLFHGTAIAKPSDRTEPSAPASPVTPATPVTPAGPNAATVPAPAPQPAQLSLNLLPQVQGNMYTSAPDIMISSSFDGAATQPTLSASIEKRSVRTETSPIQLELIPVKQGDRVINTRIPLREKLPSLYERTHGLYWISLKTNASNGLTETKKEWFNLVYQESFTAPNDALLPMDRSLKIQSMPGESGAMITKAASANSKERTRATVHLQQLFDFQSDCSISGKFELVRGLQAKDLPGFSIALCHAWGKQWMPRMNVIFADGPSRDSLLQSKFETSMPPNVKRARSQDLGLIEGAPLLFSIDFTRVDDDHSTCKVILMNGDGVQQELFDEPITTSDVFSQGTFIAFMLWGEGTVNLYEIQVSEHGVPGAKTASAAR